MMCDASLPVTRGSGPPRDSCWSLWNRRARYERQRISGLVNASARARLALRLRVLTPLHSLARLLGAPHVAKLLCHKPRSTRGHSRGVYTYRASVAVPIAEAAREKIIAECRSGAFVLNKRGAIKFQTIRRFLKRDKTRPSVR